MKPWAKLKQHDPLDGVDTPTESVLPGFLNACARVALVGWLGLFAAVSSAQSGGVEPSGGEAEGCTSDERKPLAEVVVAPGKCHDDVAWLVWVGDRLNRVARYSEALDYLERALLIEPASLPARLAYAIALAGAGDLESALSLAKDLIDDHRLPLALQRVLADRVATWRRGTAVGWRTHWSVGSRFGHDSNLLGAPNLDSLTLTIGDQSLSLPLDPSYLSRSGSFGRLDVGLEASRTMPEGLRLNVSAQLRKRLSSAVPESNFHQAVVFGELAQTPRPGAPGWYLGVAGSALDSQTGGLLHVYGIGLGAVLPAGNGCESRAGLESQLRSVRTNPVLSGRYMGLAALLGCTVEVSGVVGASGEEATARGSALARRTGDAASWQIQALHGLDRPVDADRSGGAQRQTLIRLSSQLGAWAAEIELEWRRDDKSYSPLLGDVTRNTFRRGGRIEWRGVNVIPGLEATAAGERLQLRAGIEMSAQSASLALFRSRSWGPYVALSYTR